MTVHTERNLNDKAIYWRKTGNDGEGGFTFADPVQIDCRWEDIAMVERFDKGPYYEIRSEVIVKQTLYEEDMLLKGELVDLDSAYWDNPEGIKATPIVRLDDIPSLKKSTTRFRKVYLGRLWTGKT